MVTDQLYLLFCAAFSELAAETHSIGIGHHESEPFMRKIYSEYLLTAHQKPNIKWIKSVPSTTKEWMNETISTNFLHMEKSPTWVGEPSWRFIADSPMIFISQVEFLDNVTMRDNLSTGDIIYIFSGKEILQDGWEIKIKMVKQDKNSTGTSYIN